jgi:hypothetical protein
MCNIRRLSHYNLIVVFVRSLCTVLKHKIMFTHLLNSSDILGTRVYMIEIIPNILGSKKINIRGSNVLYAIHHKRENLIFLFPKARGISGRPRPVKMEGPN